MPSPLLHVSDGVAPVVGALVFVLLMSCVREPTRHRLNALLVTGASGVYLSGGFGLWELAYATVGLVVGYRALDSYRFVAIGWLLHAAWDLLHHLYGNPIWPFLPTSSFGCLVFDSLIAIWFFAGAPTLAGPRATRA